MHRQISSKRHEIEKDKYDERFWSTLTHRRNVNGTECVQNISKRSESRSRLKRSASQPKPRSASLDRKQRNAMIANGQTEVPSSHSLDGYLFQKHFQAQRGRSQHAAGDLAVSTAFCNPSSKAASQIRPFRTLEDITNTKPAQGQKKSLAEMSNSLSAQGSTSQKDGCDSDGSPPRLLRTEAIGTSVPKHKSPELQRVSMASDLYPKRKKPEKMLSVGRASTSPVSKFLGAKYHVPRNPSGSQEGFDYQEDGNLNLNQGCTCNPSKTSLCICPHTKKRPKLNMKDNKMSAPQAVGPPQIAGVAEVGKTADQTFHQKHTPPVQVVKKGELHEESEIKANGHTTPESPSVSKTFIQRPAGAGWRGDMALDADPVPTMCFALTEVVTSISATPDGSFVACGFESGTVRLFDMTASGNTDPQDRKGCVLGQLPNTTSVKLKTQAIVAGKGAHLFAGAGVGSKKLLAWDLDHFRRLRETRGFATAHGIRFFQCDDAKAKGLADAVLLSSQDECYRYRVLCGVGSGKMNVFDAIFQNNKKDGENSTAVWSLIYSENVGGPMMQMGLFGRGGSIAVTQGDKALRVWDLTKPWEKPTKWSKMGRYEATFAVCFPEPKLITAYYGSSSVLGRLRAKLESNTKMSGSLSVETDELGNSTMAEKTSRGSRRGRVMGTVRSISTTDDGKHVLFSNSDGNVYLAYPPEERIVIGATRVRKSFGSEGSLTIFYEGIVDSFDGQTYHVSYEDGDAEDSLTKEEVMQHMLRPTVNQTLPTVSKLFTLQTEADVDIVSKIQRVKLPSASSSQQSEVLTMFAVMSSGEDSVLQEHALPPEEGSSAESSTTIGVLKVSRLTHISVTGLQIGDSDTDIATMHQDCPLLGSFEFAEEPCWFCGDKYTQHWEKSEGSSLFNPKPDPTPTRKRLSKETPKSKNLPKRRKPTAPETSSPKKPAQAPSKWNLLDNISNVQSLLMRKPAAEDSNDDSKQPPNQRDEDKSIDQEHYERLVEQLRKEVELLKAERDEQAAGAEKTKKQFDDVMRRADSRFEEERRLRKQWNVQRAAYEKRIEELSSTVQELSNSMEKRSLTVSGGSSDLSLKELAEIRKTLFAAILENQQFEDQVRAKFEMAGGNVVTGSKCLVCLVPKADVVLEPCGHLCLCETDAAQLKTNGLLKRCPYCQQSVKKIQKIRTVS